MINRFGVDVDYFDIKLRIILRDMDNYTPEELARALSRLAIVADEEAAASCIPRVPVGWKLKKVEGTVTTISITRTTDGAWCGGGIKEFGDAHGLRYEFLNDLMGEVL